MGKAVSSGRKSVLMSFVVTDGIEFVMVIVSHMMPGTNTSLDKDVVLVHSVNWGSMDRGTKHRHEPLGHACSLNLVLGLNTHHGASIMFKSLKSIVVLTAIAIPDVAWPVLEYDTFAKASNVGITVLV